MSHYPWARLHADSLLIAFLSIAVGLVALVSGQDDVTKVDGSMGKVPVLFILLYGSYVVAGVLLLRSLAKVNIRQEIVARCVMVAGGVLNIYRHGFGMGWNDNTTVKAYLVFALVALALWLRMSVLAQDVVVVSRHVPKDGTAS